MTTYIETKALNLDIKPESTDLPKIIPFYSTVKKVLSSFWHCIAYEDKGLFYYPNEQKRFELERSAQKFAHPFL